MEFRTLNPDEIEVKVKQVGENGCVALLYKTARVDYELLDEKYGVNGWQCEYTEIKGNLYCSILVWDDDKKMWVRKQNCGIESRADGDGNEKKGEASDAFKRAGFVVGIGRELYTAPFTFIKKDVCPVKKNEKGQWVLENRFTRFDVAEIGYDSNRRIDRLVITDNNGNIVFTFGKKHAPEPPKQPDAQKQPRKGAKLPEKQADVTTADKLPTEQPEAPKWDLNVAFGDFVEKHGLTKEQFTAWRDKACADAQNNLIKTPFKDMTQEQWEELFSKLEALSEMGYFDE